MAAIADIRKGLADRLRTINDLHVHEIPPAKIAPPAAVVGPVEIDYDLTFRGGGNTYRIPVRVHVSKASWEAGLTNLDEYLAPTGTRSIKAAIEGDDDLGGVIDSVRVVSARGYGSYDIGDTSYFGCEFMCEVIE